MDEYILLITIIGLAVFGMAWMPMISKTIGISYSLIYVALGALLYTIIPSALPEPLPEKHEYITLRLTELVVIISLMGTGIKIDRSFSWKNWKAPLRLISLAMVGCIGLSALAGYTWLSFDLPSAILLGAVLAPTDPVLASDVQVGPPHEKIKSETKFSLTAEAGLNDGMAFPFTWLAIALSTVNSSQNETLLEWFAFDLVYRILAGVAIGYLTGRGVGYLIFTLSKRYHFLHTRDGFLAIAVTLLVYGITEMVFGYGFIAVFIAALSIRHYEKGHDYHDDLHSFTDQAERLLVAVLLILFGGALVSGVLGALSWQMVVFTLVFLLIIRPAVAFLSLYKIDMHLKEKVAISFLGIRGMGSVFYLAFAFHELHFGFEEELWSIVSFTILCSIIMHGLTANPIMRHLKKNLKEESVPE